MRKALWIIWLAIVWFFSLVFHSMAFSKSGFVGIAVLLGVFWLIYLAGLWFEKTRITDTAWAMLLGYAIGCIRLLDLIPNQQQYANWLKHVPKFIVGGAALLFILIFIGLLPLLAQHVISSHKANNRVLGRDD
jgi:predicted ABC-type exoprotein transport system permease subunit